MCWHCVFSVFRRFTFPNAMTGSDEQFDLFATERDCAQKSIEVWLRPQGQGAGANKNHSSQ